MLSESSKGAYSLRLSKSERWGIIETQYLTRERFNPLVTQQEIAGSFRFYWTNLSPDMTRDNPDFELLAQADDTKLGRMLCGPAAVVTAINDLELGKGAVDWKTVVDPVSLLAQVFRYQGAEAFDPITRRKYERGWEVYAKEDQKDISKWSIRLQALALMAKLSGRVEAIGVNGLNMGGIGGWLESGDKVVVSCSNRVIELHERRVDLQEGTHLVALLGMEKGKVILADPYWRDDWDPVPFPVEPIKLEPYLSEKRHGLVLTKRGGRIEGLIPQNMIMPLVLPSLS
jgi:hypothetical protein